MIPTVLGQKKQKNVYVYIHEICSDFFVSFLLCIVGLRLEYFFVSTQFHHFSWCSKWILCFFFVHFASCAYRQFVNAHMCRNETKLEEEDWWERYFNIIIRIEKNGVWNAFSLPLSFMLTGFRSKRKQKMLRFSLSVFTIPSCLHDHLGEICFEIQKFIEASKDWILESLRRKIHINDICTYIEILA